MSSMLKFAPLGTYVMVKYDDSTCTQLQAWAKENNIPNVLRKDQFHSTIMQSPTVQIKDFESLNKKVDRWSFKATHFLIAPTTMKKKSTVPSGGLMMFMDAPELEDAHKLCKMLGGKHCRCFFEPHISISYEVPLNFDLSSLPLPTFKLEAKEIVAEPIDVDWLSR